MLTGVCGFRPSLRATASHRSTALHVHFSLHIYFTYLVHFIGARFGASSVRTVADRVMPAHVAVVLLVAVAAPEAGCVTARAIGCARAVAAARWTH